MNDSRPLKNAAALPSVVSPDSGIHRIALTLPDSAASMSTLKFSWLLLPFAVLFIISTAVQVMFGMTYPWFTTVVGCTLSSFLIFSYVGLLLCFLNKEFVLRQSGITLPVLYFWNARGRLYWDWSKLNSVIFSRSQRYVTTSDQIVLRFQQSEKESVDVHIKLREIDQLDLKKLIYAVVSSAPHAVIEPALDKVALEFPTVSGIKHLNFLSFTSLWDEEFSTRYSPTLFVPLAADEELQNGAIKISELVACGGSAAIYSARNKQGTQIIVKEAVVPKNANAELKAKAIEMFNREAMFLSKLDHPNIAKVLDHFVENEHHYEVIEFIDGLDLRRFVKERGPQPEDFVLNWAEQICEIVVYLHSQDPPVIHRDLTPDNLVLRVDAQLVLIDFGAANAFVGTATGTMVGKQSYMPPEQLRGKSVPQSDIYSLGATLYFLLTGKDPTPLEVSHVIKTTKVSLKLNQLVAKCTATEAADRHESALDLLNDIRSIRSQRKLEAVSAPAIE